MEVASIGEEIVQDSQLVALQLECRKMVRRRAALSALTSLIPIPGIDLITDTAVLVKLIPDINAKFGLPDATHSKLSPTKKVLHYRLLAAAGGMFASRAVTAKVVIGTLRIAGLRLTVMEATRLVPIAGQIAAAIIGYLTLSYVAGKHVDECAALAREIRQPAQE